MASRYGTWEAGQGMRIGELAGQTGVSAKTIRFYEEQGVLPPPKRARNGYRYYDEGDVQRLLFVRRARELDFSLDELKEILSLRDRGEAPCRHVMALLDERAGQVDARIKRLQVLKRDLQALRRDGEQLPQDDIDMEQCVCGLIRTGSDT